MKERIDRKNIKKNYVKEYVYSFIIYQNKKLNKNKKIKFIIL